MQVAAGRALTTCELSSLTSCSGRRTHLVNRLLLALVGAVHAICIAPQRDGERTRGARRPAHSCPLQRHVLTLRILVDRRLPCLKPFRLFVVTVTCISAVRAHAIRRAQQAR